MPSADSSAYRPQRPPGVSVKSFHWLAPGLPAPHSGWLWASRSRGRLPKGAGLIPGSCTSHPIFAFSFLRIPPRGGHPCFRLQDSDHHGSSGTWSSAAPHPLDLTHARHTQDLTPLESVGDCVQVGGAIELLSGCRWESPRQGAAIDRGGVRFTRRLHIGLPLRGTRYQQTARSGRKTQRHDRSELSRI